MWLWYVHRLYEIRNWDFPLPILVCQIPFFPYTQNFSPVISLFRSQPPTLTTIAILSHSSIAVEVCHSPFSISSSPQSRSSAFSIMRLSCKQSSIEEAGGWREGFHSHKEGYSKRVSWRGCCRDMRKVLSQREEDFDYREEG